MRKKALILTMLLMVVVATFDMIPQASAAPGFVQQKAGASASTASTPCVYGTSPVKNNFLIVSFSWYPTTITVTSVTDTLANSFTDAGVVTSGAVTQTFKSDVWYANQAATTGADTITILLSSAPTFIFFTCLEFSQVQKTLRVVEKTNTGTYTSGTSFTASVASFTPTVTDLLYSYTGFMACSATGTITYATATGFTAGTGKGTDVATGSNCITSGAVKFKFNEADQYFPNSGTTATTASFVIADSAPTVGTGGWVEIVLELEFKSFQSIAQSITLASSKTNIAAHKYALTSTVTLASSLSKVAAHIYGLAQSVTIASSLSKVAAHIYGLAQSVSNSAALKAFISLLFFHGHSTLSCITKPALVCDYQVFFTEAPTASQALLSSGGHFLFLPQSIGIIATRLTQISYFDLLIQTLTVSSALANPANHFYAITSVITVGSSLVEQIGRVITLIETITATPTLAQQLNYFIALIQSITSLAEINVVSSAHIFEELIGNITVNIRISAIVPCDLASTCAGTGGAGVALAIIGIGIAGIALYFAMTKGKRKRRRRR